MNEHFETDGGIVDAAIHVASPDVEAYPLAAAFPAAPRIFATIEDFETATAPHGVTQAVVVQPSQYGFDHRYLCDSLRSRSAEFAGVALIDPGDPRGPELLTELASEVHVTGLRLGLNFDDGRDWLGPTVDDLVNRAGELGLVVSIFMRPDHLPMVNRWLSAHPDITVVIDHLGRPDLAEGDPLDAVRALARLALFPRLFVKVSALVSLSREQFPHRDTWTWVQEAVLGLGVDRLMWGSDYPLTADGQNYGQSLEVIAFATDRLTRPERDRLLAGTARYVYGLPERGVPSGS